MYRLVIVYIRYVSRRFSFFLSPPLLYTNSIMSFIIGGVPASVAYSPHAFPSRMSASFGQQLNSTHWAHSHTLHASVTVPTPTCAFTCVLDFIITCDLGSIDVVLGLDWTNACGTVDVTMPLVGADIGKSLIKS